MTFPRPPGAARPVLRLGAVLALLVLCAVRWFASRVPHPRLPFRIPYVGDINGRMWAPPITIDNPTFGQSMTLPSILEITIDGVQGVCRPALLSEPVATWLFDGSPEFRVNVAFSCGKGRPLRPGLYADPRSRWFNVFAGYYQIDVPQRTWARPFGYTNDGRGGFQLDPDEIARLGRADWHYFSNYLYGVPLKVLKRENSEVRLVSRPRKIINDRAWDHLSGTKITVVSAFQSTLGDQLRDTWHFVNNLWRAAFGLPVDIDVPPTSFFSTDLDAELYVAWTADTSDFDLREPVFRTYVFGGTVNRWWAHDDPTLTRQNDEFLKLQMATLEALIQGSFAGIGFDPDAHPSIRAGAVGESNASLDRTRVAPPVTTASG